MISTICSPLSSPCPPVLTACGPRAGADTRAHERSGRLASAWATFREASSAAEQAGQAQRVAVANDRAARLRPRLSTLTHDFAEQSNVPTGVEVAMDGRALPPALRGVPIPVDAGIHEIVVTAPGRATWRRSLTVAPEGDRQNVEIPPLERSTGGSLVLEPLPDLSGPGSTSDGGSWSRQRWVGAGFFGAGVALLGTGLAFGLTARSKDDRAESLCNGISCPTARGASLNQEARSAALAANVSYGLGVAALASGAVLFATAPHPRAPVFGAAVAPGGGLVTVTRAF